MKNLNISEYLKGNCFVYVQGNEADKDKYFEIVRLSKDNKLILYPERDMRFIDTICYRPYVKSVITENPFIISSYNSENVWMLKDGEWHNPCQQTYGASINMITCTILHYSNTIPLYIYKGIEGIEDYKEKVRKNNFN